MSKKLSALIASAISLASLTSPCFAKESTESITPGSAASNSSSQEGAAQKSAKSETPSTGTSSTELLASTAVLPVRLVAVASALAIGTPIAVARCEAKQIGQYGEDMKDELNANQYITPLMVASIPIECLKAVGAAGKGVLVSGSNAQSAWKDPFTAKSFSLEELEFGH